MLREHRLGVELHTPVGKPVHFQRLDHAVLAARVDRDAWNLLDVQGVVSHHLEALRDAGEDPLAGVGECGDEPVARLGRLGHGRTSKHGQPLVAEAHAQQRNLRLRRRLDHAPGGAEILVPLWGARTGRDHDVTELAGADAFRQARCLAGGHDEGLVPGHLRNKVGEVERV